jgi:hypothetical protein
VFTLNLYENQTVENMTCPVLTRKYIVNDTVHIDSYSHITSQRAKEVTQYNDLQLDVVYRT